MIPMERVMKKYTRRLLCGAVILLIIMEYYRISSALQDSSSGQQVVLELEARLTDSQDALKDAFNRIAPLEKSLAGLKRDLQAANVENRDLKSMARSLTTRLSSPADHSLNSSVNLTTPVVRKLYFVNMADNLQRRQFMEKQLRVTGYAYERYDGVEMKVMTDIRRAWDTVLNRSTLPLDPWHNGWISRTPCWLDAVSGEYWGPRSHKMVGTVACALNFIGVLDRMAQDAARDPPNSMYLVMEDDCLLHTNWDRKLVDVVASLPHGWDAVRLGYWGQTSDADVVNEKVFRVASWSSGGQNMYTGNHALLLSREGIGRMLWHWAAERICWTDTAIDDSKQRDPTKPALQVYAVREKLASEFAVGKSRGDLDQRPEVHHEDTGLMEVSHASG